MLAAKGYNIYGTAGTAKFLNENGIPATACLLAGRTGDLNIMDMFSQHVFELVVNIPKDHSKRELTNGYKIRRAAIDHNIPLITNARLASASSALSAIWMKKASRLRAGRNTNK